MLVLNLGGVDEYFYAKHFVFKGKFEDLEVLCSCF